MRRVTSRATDLLRAGGRVNGEEVLDRAVPELPVRFAGQPELYETTGRPEMAVKYRD